MNSGSAIEEIILFFNKNWDSLISKKSIQNYPFAKFEGFGQQDTIPVFGYGYVGQYGMGEKIISGFQEAEVKYAVYFCLEDTLGYGIARHQESDKLSIG
jgi:hypothetical protein